MSAVMIKLLNMSITAVWLILAVVILRVVLKKAPKYINLILWALVGFRLICPVNFESILSLIPSAETIPSNIHVSSAPAINTGINAVNEFVNPVISDFAEIPYTIGFSPVDMMLSLSFAAWLFGIAIMVIYSAISYLKLHRTVKASIRYNENIYLCDNIKSPFILGIFKPRIYLPSDINANQINPVIAHEKAHIKRLDHILKPLGFAVLSIHWFNPFVWLAYSLFCRDIEYACDEKVIKEMESEEKKTYSEALLSLSITKRTMAACPLAFGEIGVKNRIKSVLSYKKPALWIIVTSVIALIAVAIGFMTTPKNNSIDGYHYIDKYYYDEVIGAERANNEMRNFSYRISPDMTITRYDSVDAGNATALGTLVKDNANENEIDLILATLPSTYSERKIKDVYGTYFLQSNKYVFIMFKNGDFIGAYLPKDSNGNYYVMDSFRLKRDHGITVEPVSDFSDMQTNKEVSTSDPSVNPEKPSNITTDTSTTAIVFDTLENLNPYFDAKVLEVNDNNVLVEPFEGEDERKSASKIYVNTDVISKQPIPELKKGDKIRIIYNGEIQETYPAGITKVFAIYSITE